MYGDEKFRRRQARSTIVSALRIIRDIQQMHGFRTSEIIGAFAKLYLNAGYYGSFRWLDYAAKQIRSDERAGGR